MSTAFTGTKPRLSFWQIWNMSFGFMGIQFGWALQMANMSSIYEFLGAKPDEIPLLWLAAPLTGLIEELNITAGKIVKKDDEIIYFNENQIRSKLKSLKNILYGFAKITAELSLYQH
jgi:hypothetical protein